MERIKKELLAAFFPPRCAVCGEILPELSREVCPGCESGFQRITQPSCMRCGKQLLDETNEYCFDCGHKRFHYIKGFPLWQYDSQLRRSIAEFKYKGRKEYTGYYVRELERCFGAELRKKGIEAFIPVPVHKSRLRKRGYNQAELLARGLSERMGIPVISDILIREKKTLPQKELNDVERLKNLSEAFCIRQKMEPVLSCVALVDDIYTTGSTVECCARCLKKAGVDRIYYISLGIGRG